MGSSRNLTLLSPSLAPLGQARPDWQLICEVAAHLGGAQLESLFDLDYHLKHVDTVFARVFGPTA